VGKHSRAPRVVASLFASFAVLIFAGLVIYIIAVRPGWFTGKHYVPPVCRFSSQSVTVDISGTNSCNIFQDLADATHSEWHSAPEPHGSAIRLTLRHETAIIWPGNRTFAVTVEDWFYKEGWR
jgi:hypothetical protein